MNVLQMQQHTPEEYLSKKVEELNRTFTQVHIKGKNYVAFVSQNEFDNPYMEFMKKSDFKEFVHPLLIHPKVEVGKNLNGSPKMRSLAVAWMEHPRSSYAMRVTFRPDKKDRIVGDALNTYMGLGVRPQPYNDDDFQLKTYFDFVKEIICNNDITIYNYLVGWMAHMIQKPTEKPQVAILLTGGQGTGKGSLVEPLGKIMGPHYTHAISSDSITGRFNSDLENKMLLFGDEFFAGSKKSTDKLKGLITEKSQRVERKSVNAFNVPSYTRLILASNHENILHIEKDERRYLSLRVSDKYQQHTEYFKKLKEVTNNPEFLSKLLRYLMDYDISKFAVMTVPKTKDLTHKKIDNLSSIERWAYDTIKTGATANGPCWPNFEDRQTLKTLINDYIKSNSLPLIFGDQSQKIGTVLTKLGFKNTTHRKDGKVQRVVRFPDINEARKLFNEYIGADFDLFAEEDEPINPLE